MTSTPPPSAASVPDWTSLIDHWAGLSSAFVEEFAARAKTNSAKLQDGSYDRDAWLDDVSWFVKRVADNATSTAKACTDLFPQPQE
jgi:hypothetical protein